MIMKRLDCNLKKKNQDELGKSNETNGILV